jgi:uncharacterized damage-inducible protein DinB
MRSTSRTKKPRLTKKGAAKAPRARQSGEAPAVDSGQVGSAHSAKVPAPAPAPAVPPPPVALKQRDRRMPVDLGNALIEAFLTNERINQVLLDLVDPGIWRTFPPCSKRRNISTTFAHIHNVRCMRLRMSDRTASPPERLDRATITRDEARDALAQSARAMVRLIEHALSNGGHVPEFRPDVVSLVCSGIAHEAHHRGQICHWLRELGAPVEAERALPLWEWDKRWREVLPR